MRENERILHLMGASKDLATVTMTSVPNTWRWAGWEMTRGYGHPTNRSYPEYVVDEESPQQQAAHGNAVQGDELNGIHGEGQPNNIVEDPVLRRAHTHTRTHSHTHTHPHTHTHTHITTHRTLHSHAQVWNPSVSVAQSRPFLLPSSTGGPYTVY